MYDLLHLYGKHGMSFVNFGSVRLLKRKLDVDMSYSKEG